MIVSMTFKIDRLAQEAADPEEAGRRMRQVYFTQVKLTKRQLTIDLLRKLYERGVGTNEVEQLAKKVIKGELRKNPDIVKYLLKLKMRKEAKFASVDKVDKRKWTCIKSSTGEVC